MFSSSSSFLISNVQHCSFLQVTMYKNKMAMLSKKCDSNQFQNINAAIKIFFHFISNKNKSSSLKLLSKVVTTGPRRDSGNAGAKKVLYALENETQSKTSQAKYDFRKSGGGSWRPWPHLCQCTCTKEVGKRSLVNLLNNKTQLISN